MGISVFLLWCWNLFISFLNARGVGLAKAEINAAAALNVPGTWWRKLLMWSATIMAGIGFTWCLLIALGFGAHALGAVTAKQFLVALELGYVLIVPLLLGTGAVITVDSWATAFREGGLLNYGTAAYNTYAQVHNTYHAIQSFGGAFQDVFKFFSSESDGEDKDKGKAAVIVLVVLAVVGGAVITYMIIQRYAASAPLLSESEMRSRQSA